MSIADLPRFTDREEHNKLVPLPGPVAPRQFLQDWLDEITADRPRQAVRVLDLGCGRGGTVAWLVDQGWDGYGIDVDERYVRNGQVYFDSVGETERLAVLDGQAYPYPDEHFDVVISDQVFEHVEDLEFLAREVARVTQPAGKGLHIFPAKWRVREPHMLTPFAHWVPKGRARRAVIAAGLRSGLAAPHFADRPLADRVEIYNHFSTTETFYRSPNHIAQILGEAGLESDYRRAPTLRIAATRGGRGLGVLNRPGGLALRTIHEMFVETQKA